MPNCANGQIGLTLGVFIHKFHPFLPLILKTDKQIEETTGNHTPHWGPHASCVPFPASCREPTCNVTAPLPPNTSLHYSTSGRLSLLHTHVAASPTECCPDPQTCISLIQFNLSSPSAATSPPDLRSFVFQSFVSGEADPTTANLPIYRHLHTIGQGEVALLLTTNTLRLRCKGMIQMP